MPVSGFCGIFRAKLVCFHTRFARSRVATEVCPRNEVEKQVPDHGYCIWKLPFFLGGFCLRIIHLTKHPFNDAEPPWSCKKLRSNNAQQHPTTVREIFWILGLLLFHGGCRCSCHWIVCLCRLLWPCGAQAHLGVRRAGANHEKPILTGS